MTDFIASNEFIESSFHDIPADNIPHDMSKVYGLAENGSVAAGINRYVMGMANGDLVHTTVTTMEFDGVETNCAFTGIRMRMASISLATDIIDQNAYLEIRNPVNNELWHKSNGSSTTKNEGGSYPTFHFDTEGSLLAGVPFLFVVRSRNKIFTVDEFRTQGEKTQPWFLLTGSRTFSLNAVTTKVYVDSQIAAVTSVGSVVNKVTKGSGSIIVIQDVATIDTAATDNVVMGWDAALTLGAGDEGNVIIGESAAQTAFRPRFTNLVGRRAGEALTIDVENNSLELTVPSYNNGYGYGAMQFASGSRNNVFGYRSFRNGIGDLNTIIGHYSGRSLTGNGNTLIGCYADPSGPNVNNEMTLGGGDIDRIRAGAKLTPVDDNDLIQKHYVDAKVSNVVMTDGTSSETLAPSRLAVRVYTQSKVDNAALSDGTTTTSKSPSRKATVDYVQGKITDTHDQTQTEYKAHVKKEIDIVNDTIAKIPKDFNEVVWFGGNVSIVNYEYVGGQTIYRNTIIGQDAGLSLAGSEASRNTVIGYNAATNLKAGNANVTIGYLSGESIGPRTDVVETVENVTAVGSFAYQEGKGHSNTAYGYAAGRATSSTYGVYLGHSSGRRVAGGYNVTIGNRSGYYMAGDYNVTMGYEAGLYTIGGNNIVIGKEALKGKYLQSVHVDNIAIGTGVLTSATSSNGNVGVGHQALYLSVDGEMNTAIGYKSSMLSNGKYSTSIGAEALSRAGSSSSSNTAVGYKAGYSLVQGSDNISIGSYSGGVVIGDDNVSLGSWTLRMAGNGEMNTAIGNGSLSSVEPDGLPNVTANTALGYDAGSKLKKGNYNTFIGYDSQPEYVNANNLLVLGGKSTYWLYSNIHFHISTSDKRDKTAIIDCPVGLEYINELRPVQYTWDYRKEHTGSDGVAPIKQGTSEVGFLAQDLKATQDKYRASALHSYKHHPAEEGEEGKLGIDMMYASYGTLLPVAIKAIQELSTKLDKAMVRIKELESKE